MFETYAMHSFSLCNSHDNLFLQIGLFMFWIRNVAKHYIMPMYVFSDFECNVIFSEWVSDCCLTSTQQFAAISWREPVNFQWDEDVRFVLDQHAELDFYRASSLKQQSAGRHVSPLGYILIPSQPVFVLTP